MKNNLVQRALQTVCFVFDSTFKVLIIHKLKLKVVRQTQQPAQTAEKTRHKMDKNYFAPTYLFGKSGGDLLLKDPSFQLSKNMKIILQNIVNISKRLMYCRSFTVSLTGLNFRYFSVVNGLIPKLEDSLDTSLLISVNIHNLSGMVCIKMEFIFSFLLTSTNI